MLAAAVVISMWRGVAAAAVAVVALWLARPPHALLLLATLLAVVGAWRADRSWADAQPRHVGAYTGWANVAADPAPFGRALRVTLEVEGERFDAWCYGRVRAKLAERQQGERVWVQGVRRTLDGTAARRAAIRHVVGRMDLEVVADWADEGVLWRAGNRVRTALRGAADAAMQPNDAALFTGLVIGDDSRQPLEMIERFRASGLSHLTAVSGQNVALLLAAASPLLRRLRPWARWLTTLGLVVWFMGVTRFEPSVLRAGAMAMLASTAFLAGRDARPVRLLGWAVAGLVLLDPMLVWSVGFWLSVGATLGVCSAGPWLESRLPGPGWLTAPLGVTLGAQLGVVVPSLLVFGRLPLVSVLANLVAVPAAGFVMLVGLPAGLLAAAVPGAAEVVLLPAEVGTRWVATVAFVASEIEPSPAVGVVGWLLTLLGVVVLLARLHLRGRGSRVAS
mgnify:CR=1 FL=1